MEALRASANSWFANIPRFVSGDISGVLIGVLMAESGARVLGPGEGLEHEVFLNRFKHFL